MKRKLLRFGCSAILLLCLAVQSKAIDPTDTRMLSQPAISATHIAFVYAEDIWIANIDGSEPRRLTVKEGSEFNPVFSPDGKYVAFSGNYDGNVDVYIVPTEGGIPKRLTWHPQTDLVRCFTPDGSSVLFISQRNSFTNRYLQLFTVPVKGGMPEQLVIPNAFWANYSPDGKEMVYTPLFDAFREWKHYRGGMHSVLQIFNFTTHATTKIPQPEGGCNDVSPMWIGSTIYFRSDRNGEFNLFGYDTQTKNITQLTHFKDFPILNATADQQQIIFEQAGYLHIFTPGENKTQRLKIGIATDLLELRSRYAQGRQYIRSASISPTGKRVAFDFRGDIVTLPADKGDARNITQTTGAHEKFPAWSPDGKNIAFFSDASGEYQLYIKAQDGKSEATVFPLTGTGFYADIKWSPDNKKICFVDNSRTLYIMDVASGKIKKIANDEIYLPGTFRLLGHDWSPDSKWFAYTKVLASQFEQVFLYSIDENKSYPVSDGLSNATEPTFDRSGKYLYFFASTDAGPLVNWFDQSNGDLQLTESIYLVTLQKETISPFAKESDEEKIATDEKEKPKTDKSEDKSNDFHIDWVGIQDRIVNIPVPAGNYTQLAAGSEGEILYVENSDDGMGQLHTYQLDKRKDDVVMPVNGYQISADGKMMLYFLGGNFYVNAAGQKNPSGKGQLNINDIEVKLDPQKEWPEIFDEAWRINKSYFYDPGMHGVDWDAMKKKYEVFLPDLSCRNDLNRLIEWMCSELSVGHHRLTNGGDFLYHPEQINGGLLGADYKLKNNRYQIEKIYGGLNWNPDLRSPLTEPGVNANVGDYILAVNHKNVTAADNLYSFFENTAGKIVELTLSSSGDEKDARVVKVVPIANESSLRNRDWVEGNLKKVDAATDGQVAYVYVPNTARLGLDYFKRYFYPQADRKAIIVDERFNGGGQIADYYIDLLQQPLQAYWHTRYGKDFKTPSASIQGPKVLLIDETAGSGGDMFPWMFRKFKIGTIIGKRTWGGLVGILGFPEFLDGGGVTAPNLGIWTKDGFIVENYGVAPDIEVEQTPAAIINGRDPQLEKAIEVVLQQLKNNPPVTPKRPPFPIKVKN